MEVNQNPSPPVTPDTNLVPQPVSSPPNPIPVKPVSKFSIKAIISAIIFLLLAGGAAAGYVYREPLMKFVAKPTPTPIVSVSPTSTPDPTTDWKTYEGEGFSIKYPADFFLSQQAQNAITISSENIETQGMVNINESVFVSVVPMPAKDNETYYGYDKDITNKLLAFKIGETKSVKFEDDPENSKFFMYTRQKDESINNRIGKVFTGQIWTSPPEKIIYITNSNFLYILGGYSSDENFSFFDQILSTFKFTESEPLYQEGWKTYISEDTLVTFKYPPDFVVKEIDNVIYITGPSGKFDAGTSFITLDARMMYAYKDYKTSVENLKIQFSDKDKHSILTEKNKVLVNNKPFYQPGDPEPKQGRIIYWKYKEAAITAQYSVASKDLADNFNAILDSVTFK